MAAGVPQGDHRPRRHRLGFMLLLLIAGFTSQNLKEAVGEGVKQEEQTEQHTSEADLNEDQLPSPGVIGGENAQQVVASANVELEALLQLVDAMREKGKQQLGQAAAIHFSMKSSKAPTQQPGAVTGASGAVEQCVSSHLKTKTMKVQDGFTETAAATILGKRSFDEDVRMG
ncbi:protein phosphatase 1a (formerly 2c) magnesium- alpha related protein [Cyclospora cayetanensis]|uniref:Protein phosphatase 1a (Formerly 2c) magnesium-alpha related protein n=1 Tax=Cyclospora cayetanensis TaxID=88456 RepID=A0A1D3D3H1_9EIME|nr:protein phosphatase 1a (formerly 2c) magnesium- alpha related protein [Cyclospora cayetanensis]